MLTQENRNDLFAARKKYEFAMKQHHGVNAAKDGLKNVMFNCYPDLISVALDTVDSEAVKELKAKVKDLEEQITMLNEALKESDDENNDLRKQLRELNGKQQQKKRNVKEQSP